MQNFQTSLFLGLNILDFNEYNFELVLNETNSFLGLFSFPGLRVMGIV